MLGLSFQEMLVIAVVALVALGPEQLPGAMRRFGKLMREVNRALADARESLEREEEPADRPARGSAPPPPFPPAAPVHPALAPDPPPFFPPPADGPYDFPPPEPPHPPVDPGGHAS